METPEQALGRVLAELRTARSLTQEELADASECHRTYVSLLERGKHSPSVTMLFQLTRALGLTPSELLRRVEERLSAASTGSRS